MSCDVAATVDVAMMFFILCFGSTGAKVYVCRCMYVFGRVGHGEGKGEGESVNAVCIAVCIFFTGGGDK